MCLITSQPSYDYLCYHPRKMINLLLLFYIKSTHLQHWRYWSTYPGQLVLFALYKMKMQQIFRTAYLLHLFSKLNYLSYVEMKRHGYIDTINLPSNKTTASPAVLGSPKHMLNDLYNIQAENNGKDKND